MFTSPGVRARKHMYIYKLNMYCIPYIYYIYYIHNINILYTYHKYYIHTIYILYIIYISHIYSIYIVCIYYIDIIHRLYIYSIHIVCKYYLYSINMVFIQYIYKYYVYGINIVFIQYIYNYRIYLIYNIYRDSLETRSKSQRELNVSIQQGRSSGFARIGLYLFVHISCIKSGTEVVEDLSQYKIRQKFRFCYHWRAIDTELVRLTALKMSRQNHSHLIISFSNHHHVYSFVHISSIKSGTEVVGDFSLRRIERIFRFCYHQRATDTVLVLLIELQMSQQNHSHIMI